ncbi:hypothetical protein B9T16_29225 [Arthrospira sp. PCC 8006]
MLNSEAVTRIYLDELEGENGLGVGIIKLVVASESVAIASAQQLIEQAQQILPPAPLRRDIIDLIETIVVYKLPQASREEIARMLGLTDLKQTRFYQSVGATIALLESYQPIFQGSMNFRSPISS